MPRIVCLPCVFLCVAVLALCTLGCLPAGHDRCGEGYELKAPYCWPIADTSATTTATTEPDEVDAGTDLTSSSDTTPTGVGKTCETQAECAGLDADYCGKDPMQPDQPGACTIQGCDVDPAKCPAAMGLVCCKFTGVESLPSMCLPQQTYDSIAGLVGC